MTGSKVGAFLKKYTMVIALIAVIIFFYFSTDGQILVPQNISNLISQNGYVFVLATGMLLCILTGGNIDLAVGSVVCFAGGCGAIMMDKNIHPLVACIAMLVIGLLIGMWQGFWIAYVKVPPFIATLAGMFAFRGLSNVVMGGFAISLSEEHAQQGAFLQVFGGGAKCYIPDFIGSDEKFNLTCMLLGVIIAAVYVVITLVGRIRAKSQGYKVDKLVPTLVKMVVIAALIVWMAWMLAQYKGIPTILLWIAGILLVYGYITKKTTFGRNLYAVGGNEKATRLSGIDTRKVFFTAYANMGLLAGLAGIVNIARYMSAQPTYGQGYEMDAIAACFIGGASAYGGIGSVGGVVLGASLLGIINQGMSIMGMNANYQKVVKGIVLLLAILFDVLGKKKKK
ncbi:MAG: sugar ABC transporter permease [Lachnospiraceae bacterium]|nr:sugar ABC transporter permease [Lachnospiraceae bacterium]